MVRTTVLTEYMANQSASGRLVNEREDVLDLRDAVAYHQLVLSAEGARPQTRHVYFSHERTLLDGFEALGIPLGLDELTTANVRRVLEWYRRHPRGQGTRDGEVAARQFVQRMHTFANFLAREDVIEEGRLRRLKPPKVDKVLREPFTEPELAAMLGACRISRTPLRDEALFLLLLATGVRIGEAAALTLDRLRLEQRHIIVGKGGKGRRERLVPIGVPEKRDGGRVVRALRAYLADRGLGNPRVFLSEAGQPLDAVGASKIIQRLGRHAGVENAIPHRLRHTFATNYLTVNVNDENGLREILGHVSHDVLSDYIHFSRQVVAERAARGSLAETLLASGQAAPPRYRPEPPPLLSIGPTAEPPGANEEAQPAGHRVPSRGGRRMEG
jgi:site-specific recombinase XerD